MKESYTLKELQREKIHWVSEDDNNYYVRLKTDELYDNAMWVVNKNTKEVSYMDAIEFTFGAAEDTKSLYETTKPIDIETFKRVP